MAEAITDLERAARLCEERAKGYRAKLAQMEARGIDPAALATLDARAETSDNLAAAIRALATKRPE